MTTPRTLIDLSHTVEHGLVTYKGLPAPIICDYLSREASRKLYAPGTEFQIGKIEMVANTGTYLDSPFHRYADGKDLSRQRNGFRTFVRSKKSIRGFRCGERRRLILLSNRRSPFVLLRSNRRGEAKHQA